jgi:hypothetical protein
MATPNGETILQHPGGAVNGVGRMAPRRQPAITCDRPDYAHRATTRMLSQHFIIFLRRRERWKNSRTREAQPPRST